MIPREQHGVLQNEGTDSISPGHFRIAEYFQIPCDPHQSAIVGVAGDIRIAEGDIDSILSHGRGIHRQIGFLASSLIDAETEVMPPQFFAGVGK